MDAIKAIQDTISCGEFVSLGYLNDLTDDEMMRRPGPGCNHVNWQVGHLVSSDYEMINKILPGSLSGLPEGFESKYSKETVSIDDPGAFLKKDELLKIYHDQRAAILKLLEQQTPEDLDRASGLDYAPTVGAVFSMLGMHWLMHAGQWVVVRRQVGRAPLF